MHRCMHYGIERPWERAPEPKPSAPNPDLNPENPDQGKSDVSNLRKLRQSSLTHTILS